MIEQDNNKKIPATNQNANQNSRQRFWKRSDSKIDCGAIKPESDPAAFLSGFLGDRGELPKICQVARLIFRGDFHGNRRELPQESGNFPAFFAGLFGKTPRNYRDYFQILSTNFGNFPESFFKPFSKSLRPPPVQNFWNFQKRNNTPYLSVFFM